MRPDKQRPLPKISAFTVDTWGGWKRYPGVPYSSKQQRCIAAQPTQITVAVCSSAINLMPKKLTGSCQCGAVSYTTSSEPLSLNYCYCIGCQKTSGSPFITWLGLTKQNVKWSGTLSELRTGHHAIRTFCSKCGSTIGMQYYLMPNKTYVATGTISTSDFELPGDGEHIFVKDKPRWYKIADKGPQYQEFDPTFERLLNDFLVL